MEERSHPTPFRTRQLSSPSPMILQSLLWESRSPPSLCKAPAPRHAPGAFDVVAGEPGRTPGSHGAENCTVFRALAGGARGGRQEPAGAGDERQRQCPETMGRRGSVKIFHTFQPPIMLWRCAGCQSLPSPTNRRQEYCENKGIHRPPTRSRQAGNPAFPSLPWQPVYGPQVADHADAGLPF